MSALERIAFYRGVRGEGPNQELARELAGARDLRGIDEIAANLWNKNRNVQSDCLKVLYEVGYIAPELIAEHVPDFLKLLKSTNNRLVWGAMIATATVSRLKAAVIWKEIDTVIEAVEGGSVITVVWGVRALAGVASTRKAYRSRLTPILLKQLRTCLPRDVATHAESILPAIDKETHARFLAVLALRQPDLSAAQQARLRKVRRQLEAG